MKYRVSQISRLKKAEQLAINLLRGASNLRAPPEAVTAFQAFGRQLADGGSIIQNGDAPTVNADEFRALGLLAALQRDRPSTIVDLQIPLAASAQHCAVLLDGIGYRLDYRLVSYLQATPPNVSRQGKSGESEMSFAEVHDAVSARAEARRSIMEIIAREGVVRTIDLRKMGVSQDTLRKMVRQRVLRRIARGTYAPNLSRH
jgi:hypothetical protein